MKKNKIFMLALTGTLMASNLVMAASAATIPTATIDTNRDCSLSVYKYDQTKAQEGGVDITQWNSTGKPDSEAQTALKDYAVEGVEFTYLRVGDIETYTQPGKDGVSQIQVVYGFQKKDKLLDILELEQSDAVQVTGNTVYFASDRLSDALADVMVEDNVQTKNRLENYIAADGVEMKDTDKNGKTGAAGLDTGLYLVVETEVPEEIVSTVDPFFVSLPMTDQEGDNWMYDVTVYPKNHSGNPTLEKTVTEVTTAKAIDYQPTATGSDGDVVAYHIESILPTITSQASYLTEYTYVDTLSKGIEYNRSDVVIEMFSDSACSHLIATWKETDSEPRFNVTYGEGEDASTTMTIRMTENGLKEINPKYSACTMRISYACTVNSDADVVYGDSGNPNEVTLTWIRTNTSFSDTLDDDCTVYTYGLDMTKQFSGDCTDYDAVSFKVQNKTDNYYLIASGENGIYYVTDRTEDESKATAFVPGKDGKLLVYGLEDDTYVITELTTADGYTLLKDSIEVVINAAVSEDGESRTASAKVDGKSVTMTEVAQSKNTLAPLTIVNTRGFDLPQTGGEGAMLLTVGGMLTASVGGLCTVMLMRKKK